MRQSLDSFLNAWENTHVTRAIISIFFWNTCWRHSRSLGETKYTLLILCTRPLVSLSIQNRCFSKCHKFHKFLNQYQACLYLYESISHGDSKYSHEIPKFWYFWRFCDILDMPSAHVCCMFSRCLHVCTSGNLITGTLPLTLPQFRQLHQCNKTKLISQAQITH